jgi:hypothetical protein
LLDEHEPDTIVKDGKAQVNKSILSTVFLGTVLVSLCVLVMLSGVGCSDNGKESDEISVEQATDLLNHAVEYATSHDLDKLCGLGSSSLMCQTQWKDAGEWAGVPTESPQIVDTYLIPTKKLGNGMTQRGGRLLVVCGIDGMGKPYRTEMLVFSGGWLHGLSAMNVVYWSGTSIKFDSDGSSTTDSDSDR